MKCTRATIAVCLLSLHCGRPRTCNTDIDCPDGRSCTNGDCIQSGSTGGGSGGSTCLTGTGGGNIGATVLQEDMTGFPSRWFNSGYQANSAIGMPAPSIACPGGSCFANPFRSLLDMDGGATSCISLARTPGQGSNEGFLIEESGGSA